jgi:RNA polymerase sigma-70 factor, ECF subfamily
MSVASAICPQRLSDEQLLQRYAAGNRQVLEELFDRYRLPAYRVAHRLLGNEADALDAVQEGFVKALSHLDSFQGRSSFKTWLFRVVSNAALDLGRARSRRELLSLDAPRETDSELMQPMVDEDPAWGLERADLRHLLQEALAQLSDAQQRTFVLHADGGLSYREVAEVLEISIGTVMSRLFYARQKLRSWLAPRLPDGTV